MLAPPPSARRRRQKSVAHVLLNKVFEGLRSPYRWISRETGGFAWWASGHATRIQAEPPVRRGDDEVTRVHVSTPLVRGARTGDDSACALAGLNADACLSAIVQDASDPSRLALRTLVYVYPGCEDRMGMLLRQVAGLQALQAFWTAPVVASLVDGEPDVRPHPKSGLRPEPSPNLALLDGVSATWGVRPSLYEGVEFLTLGRAFEAPPCLLASGDPTRLTAEFPFLGGSSLLELVTDETHETLGNGLRARLTLPIGGSRAERAAIAMRLNRHELESPAWTSFLGSWADLEGSVTFTAFYPNFVHRPELVLDIGFGLACRARWVAEKVFHDDWNRIPARSAVERLASRELPS